MRRLLYLGHVWPEPRSSAGGERSLSVMRVFHQAGWQVTFACSAEPGARAEGLEAVTSSRASIELNKSSFDAFVKLQTPDVVMFDRFMTEEQFGWRVEDQCPNALRVVDTIDLHCLRKAREASCDGPESERTLLRTGDLAKREVASILRSDLALMISQVEIEVLEREFGVDPDLLAHLPFLFEPADQQQQVSAARTFEERTGFVTIGNFLHPPNRDAVEWLGKEIWPLIRQRLPQAEMDVYGAYTPKAVQQLDNPSAGFRVRGWATDAVEVLGRSRVCLAPLRFGAGLKGKIADAMRAGTPVVTTTFGAESMGYVAQDDDWCGRVRDDAASIVEAAVELHESPSSWRGCHARGFEIVAEHFDAAALGAGLLARVEKCMGLREQRREANFLGAMLRHHQHRASEFLSRWIEAKNRLPKS